MLRLLEILVGTLTLGLPVWFAYLDRGAFPKLLWIQDGDPPPIWGRLVVLVGVGLGVLIALAAPFSEIDSSH